MVIIGVSGGSGCGKSTISEIFYSKIDNSDVIHIDDYMNVYLEEYKNEIIEELGVNIDGDYWRNYIFNSFNDVLKWGGILSNKIEMDIRKYITESNAKVFIIDSFMLPLLPIYKNCNFTISVSCSHEVELKRLKDRLDKIEGRIALWKEDALVKSIKYTTFTNFGYQETYNINNNQSISELKKQVNKILSIKFSSK